MFVAKTAVRNREIFAAYQKGDLVEDLATRYELSVPTVREVIRIEKHKVAVSADVFYEEIRTQKLRTQP